MAKTTLNELISFGRNNVSGITPQKVVTTFKKVNSNNEMVIEIENTHLTEDATVYLTPGYLGATATNLIKDGEVSATLKVNATHPLLNVKKFLHQVNEYGIIINGIRIRSNNDAQLDKIITINRFSFPDKDQTDVIILGSYISELSNSSKIATINCLLCLDKATDLSIVIPAKTKTVVIISLDYVKNESQAIQNEISSGSGNFVSSGNFVPAENNISFRPNIGTATDVNPQAVKDSVVSTVSSAEVFKR